MDWSPFLVIFLCFSGGFAEDDHLSVAISKGVTVTEITDVVLYHEEQFLNFFIQDVPDIPTLVSFDCPDRPYTESCELTSRLNEINEDSLRLLTLMNKLFTKAGLNEDEARDPVKLNANLQSGDGEPVRADALPSETAITLAGSDWFSTLRQRLLQRKITEDDHQAGPTKVKRSPAPFWGTVGKAVTSVAALFGIDDLYNMVTQTFVSKDKILNFLTSSKAYMPEDRKAFAEVQQKTSELETLIKSKFAEVVNDSQQLRNITEHIDSLVSNHALDLTLIQESYSQTARILADTTTILFTSLVYGVNLYGFQACRSKYLPHMYVPPSLLQETLTKLESSLDEDTELAIPSENSHLYYTLERMSKCTYDGAGAMLSLMVPLRQRGSILQLYQVRPIQYAWLNHTCVLAVDASYIIRDKRTSLIYPVTAVDEKCNPVESNKCLVPVSTADDVTSSCVSIILSGGTAEQIKDGCPITCSPHAVPEIAKVGPSTFVATHIKANSLSIACPNENYTVSEEVEHGAHLIVTGCSCRLYLDGRLITRSTQTVCRSTDVLKVEALLPVHFSSHVDLIHFSDAGQDDVIRYKAKDEIFNNLFFQELHPAEDDSYLTTKVNLYAVLWGVVQSMVSAYIYFQHNRLAALILQMAPKIPQAMAANPMHCRLPPEAYHILIAILVMCALSIIPQTIYFIWSLLRRCFWNTVDMQVKKREIQKNESGTQKQVTFAPVDKPVDKPVRRKSYSSSDEEYPHGYSRDTHV